MADAALILGVTGILTSGVIGPVVLHQTQKARDRRDDARRTLDAATEPLVSATAAVEWLRGRLFEQKDADWGKRLEELQKQVYLLESHTLRLHMRFGDSALTKAYGAAGGALREQASILWNSSRGAFRKAQEVLDRLSEADHVYDEAYHEFLHEARRVHKGAVWPVGTPMSRSSRSS